MFHFAEPEEAGLGVMILTPGLTRSSQVLMLQRVALAHQEHHLRVGEDALGGVLVPALVDQAGVDQLRHVGLEGEVDLVGVQAAGHRARLVTGGAVRRREA